MKYFIIGDEDTVLGFGMVGVFGQAVRNAEEAEIAFNDALEDKNNGIIIITEKIADFIREKVDQYIFTQTTPLVIEIPDRNGKDPNRPDIRQFVNNSIGIKL